VELSLQSQPHAEPLASVSAERLFAAFYDDLHRLARSHVARRVRDVSMSATALLHEAYLDMAPRQRVFEDRGRFLAYASRVMHARIVDHFRRVHTRKRGSAVALRPLQDDLVGPETPGAGERARVGQALASLASAEPQLADIVELRFYGGFTYAEIAEMRGLSLRTVQRLWGRARVYLRDAIRAASGGPGIVGDHGAAAPVESQGRFPSIGS
jgi:RNA polymerase sigma factor (TIGR02999 family)